MTLLGVKIPQKISFVEWGHRHHDKIPDKQNCSEFFVHFPVVGMRGPDEEGNSKKKCHRGVENSWNINSERFWQIGVQIRLEVKLTEPDKVTSSSGS